MNEFKNTQVSVPVEAPVGKPIVTTTVTVPETTWKRIRNLATERRISAKEIWVSAITEYLDRQERADAA